MTVCSEGMLTHCCIVLCAFVAVSLRPETLLASSETLKRDGLTRCPSTDPADPHTAATWQVPVAFGVPQA